MAAKRRSRWTLRTRAGTPPHPRPAQGLDDLTRAALDSLPAAVAVLDAGGTILAANRSWTASVADGDASTAAVGESYIEGCIRDAGADPAALGRAADLRAVLRGEREDLVHTYSCPGPEGPRWFVLRAVRFAGAEAPHVVLQRQEVSAQREAEDAARFGHRLLDVVDAAVVALDEDGLVTSWNRGAEALYGWSGEEALGRAGVTLLLPELTAEAAAGRLTAVRTQGHWEGKTELQRKDGTRFPAYARYATLEGRDADFRGFVGVAVDITEQLRDERTLRSARDYLHAVTASMGEGLMTLDRGGRVVYVNPMAEELLGWTLAELAGRHTHEMLHHTRADGSPFPAEDCPLVQARQARGAARIDDDVMVRRDGTLLPVQQVMTPFETADGVGGFVLVFSDITQRKREALEAARRLRDLSWIEGIRDALDEDRFVLHAQPIVDIATGRTVQHELLIRMLDPQGELVAPGEFLPIAESYGLIGEIDRWVVGQGIRHAAQGRAVELNLSAHSLSDPTLYDFVDAELRRAGADPTLVVFELTETALLRDEEAAFRFVSAITERGCGLALDDFGTGYGGFSYLKRLPVDYLKIDIEFVRDLATEPASRQVVDAVVSLARGFGIKTVAEGVEDAATLSLLEQHGVDYAQGFHTGRPRPTDGCFSAGEACPA